jgi:hypothetical protein
MRLRVNIDTPHLEAQALGWIIDAPGPESSAIGSAPIK